MLTSLIEGLLPGARNLRPPLISGLLWALLLWSIFADDIPEQDAATGWAKQVYEVIGAAGPITTGVILSVLIFVLGSTLSGIAEALSAIIGRITLSLQRAAQWQKHAHQSTRRLRREATSLASRLEEAERAVAAAGATPDVTNTQRVAVSIRKHEQAARDRLALVNRQGWRKIYIPDSSATRQALGNPPATAHEGLEGELVEAAWRQGLVAGEDELKEIVSDDDLFRYGSGRGPDDRAFEAELGTDPLEVVRALNESLYLELDRVRAERDVRLAMATPILAFGLYATIEWSDWWLAFCILPLSFIIRYSFSASQERTYVLQLMRLHNLKTPALQQAFDSGRARVRTVLRAKNADEEERRKQQEAAEDAALQSRPTP